MRWFMDTEFDENGTTIKLISIAFVSESGEPYYRVPTDGWLKADCNDWVKANVLPHLPHVSTWRPRATIANEIRSLLLRDGAPEIWGYFCDYDWVALCQLFGTMMNLPEGFPMYCLDLKQEMHRLGITKEQLPPQPENAHDALADARWIRAAWLALREIEARHA